jgi:CotS family spore coat protein
MEGYQIVPWDITRQGAEAAGSALDWDMHVPPEIDVLAEAVIKQYDMSVSNRTLITSKPDKGGAIWRIETNKGPRSLKLLHRAPQRSLFSVGLQEYVVKQGARVPALIPAKDGKMFVEMGGKLWIVTDWIALQPATKVDLVGAQELCYGLGEFHKHSKGYMPPIGAKNSSRLYRWNNYYAKIHKKIGWMKEIASAYKETTASASILSVADEYQRQAQDAITQLKASSYPKMVTMGEPHWGLVHQDYGWSNGQNGPGGLWVIDLDGVSYDLPFRDLRKLITSTMDDMGAWDVSWMRGMIEAYHKANPLDAESFEVLLIDMAMPNEFYKHLKEMFFDPVTFLNTEAEAILQRVVATDKTKWQALAELSKDKGKYAAGTYKEMDVANTPEKVSSKVMWEETQWNLQQKTQQADPAQKEEAAVKKEAAAVKKERVSVKKERVSVKKEAAPVKKEAVPAATIAEPKKVEKKTVDTRESVRLEPVKRENRPFEEEREAAASISPRRRIERKRSFTTPDPSNVINLLPYLSNRSSRKTSTRTATSSSRVTSVGSASKSRKVAESKEKRSQKAKAVRSKRTEVSKTLSKKRTTKPLTLGSKVSRSRQSSTGVSQSMGANTLRKAAAKTTKRTSKKQAVPRNRVTSNLARKPKAKQGSTKAKGLR